MCQDVNKNLQFYNTTQFSYSNFPEAGIKQFPPSLFNSNSYPYDNAKALGINMNFGYFLIPHHFALGVSAGINIHSDPELNLFPIGFDIRYLIFNKPNSPYLYCQLRKQIKLGDDFYKGNEQGFGAGFKFKLAHATFLLFDVKYCSKLLLIEDDRSHAELSFKGLEYSLGMMF